MKAYMEGGTNDGQALEIGAHVPEVTVRAYAHSALAREPQPGEVVQETYRYTGRTHNAGLYGTLPVYTIVSVVYVEAQTRPAAPRAGREGPSDGAASTVIAGDEVPPP